jgi:hypothetical protein
MSQPAQRPEPFNPNGGEAGGFPVYEHAYDIDSYARAFAGMNLPEPSQFQRWVTGLTDDIVKAKSEGIAKALTMPPEMVSFARISMLPEVHNGGVQQWPGMPPEALRKVVRENLIPQTIINLRVGDVLRYQKLSKHPWKPGWRITLRQADRSPGEQDLKDILAAQKFLLNCNRETENARERDKKKLTNFAGFLSEVVRDSLTYDGMAVWTDRDLMDRVKSFKAYSAFNMRLCGPDGYRQDPNVFAVAIDEAGQVIHKFTREQLVFSVRNPRADADIMGYGYPEIEMTIRLIQAFQNVIDMNADIFNRNSIPNGFLTATGMWNQRQLDVLTRIWQNLKRGISKSWALPVIPIPKDGKIEVVDLSRLKENETYYADFMNMVAGLFCAIYKFPVTRLGYHISGHTRDSKPEVPATAAPGIDDYDPYLSVLLDHVATLINEYLIWDTWSHLEFGWTGCSPKEDAREYEARVLASTVDERRALNDDPPLESLGKDEDEKKILRIMGKAPVDPALTNVFQSIVQAVLAPKPAPGEGGKGAPFDHKKDPARAEDHGHTSGVRRDSRAESSKAAAPEIFESQLDPDPNKDVQDIFIGDARPGNAAPS